MLEIRKQNVKTLKEPIKTKQNVMELSQISQRREQCMKEIILCFQMNFKKLHFSLQVNSYLYFQARTEVLRYWDVGTLGDLQSTSKGLETVVKI
jgi:hypothetical protein